MLFHNRPYLFRIVYSVFEIASFFEGGELQFSSGFCGHVSMYITSHQWQGTGHRRIDKNYVVTCMTWRVTDADQSRQATAVSYYRIFHRPVMVLPLSATLRIDSACVAMSAVRNMLTICNCTGGRIVSRDSVFVFHFTEELFRALVCLLSLFIAAILLSVVFLGYLGSKPRGLLLT
jgi:hypothetical protein